MSIRLPILLSLVISALSLPAVAQETTLVVYSGQHEGLTQEWADGFTKETGVKVTLRNGSDNELGNQLLQEGAASPADLFLTENSPAAVLVDKAGLLEPLPADVRAEVPAQFQPAAGNWLGIAARSTVFAYNNALLTEDQLPKSVMDLATPEWQGRWAASPSGADFQAIIAAMLQLKGEQATADWLKAMKANATIYRSNTAAMQGVNRDEIEGALIYHYYYYADRAQTGENSDHIALHFFKDGDPGAFVSVSGGAVLKSSQHKPEALAFLKWLAGTSGQNILRTGTSFEYAVGNGVASASALPPLASLQPPTIDPGSLDSQKVTQLMTDAGLI